MKLVKSKVVLLPCREYDEEKIHMLLKQGLDFLGGVETLIPKEAKVLLKPNLLKKAEVEKAEKSLDHATPGVCDCFSFSSVCVCLSRRRVLTMQLPLTHLVLRVAD